MKIVFLWLLLYLSVGKANDEFPLIPIIPTTNPTITADKVKGTITVYWPDTNKSITQPALFGRVKSNELHMDNYDNPRVFDNITPAGSFPITKMISWRLNEPMLVFIQGRSSVAAIHPLWMGNPDQKRIQRLKSPTPTDNRITGGCINVDATFFYTVLNHLPDGTILTILPE